MIVSNQVTLRIDIDFDVKLSISFLLWISYSLKLYLLFDGHDFIEDLEVDMTAGGHSGQEHLSRAHHGR